jgi:tetratricopeptide (TPR) repeat protein
MAEINTIRIFISSPGDVFEERTLAQRVIERVQAEFTGRAVLEPVFWEHEPLLATDTFQTQISMPSEADVMVAILWSRLGTRLPKDFTRKDGSRYESGTEFEFEDAVEGFREHGKPQLLVYRKTAKASVQLDDEKALMDRIDQKRKLDNFIANWFHHTEDGSLKAAFHPFESPSEFEHVLERHLRKMVMRALPDSGRHEDSTAAVWKQGSPFRGLQSFEYEHAPIFFGRTKAIGDVLDLLRRQAAGGRAFVLVLGMSGGGKSSLARAGVLPMLTQPGVIEGVGHWRRAVFRPSDVRGDLFLGLATAILREPGLRLEDTSAEELAEVLKSSPAAAVTLIKTALARDAAEQSGRTPDKRPPETRLALVIDQMEEIFTQDWVTPQDRERFIDTIDVLARCGRVWVVATFRADMYPRCASLPKLVALKEGAGQYDLMPPTATEIGQMVRLPTRAAGLRFEEDFATNERLDDMLRDAAAARPELLPLLQFTLEELYQRRRDDGTLTLEAYRELGGVEGSLARRAETVFEQLPAEVQAALPRVLDALIHVRREGQEAIGRRRARQDDFETPAARKLINAFIEARLFVTELDDDGQASIMVTHEALLWHWPRVKEWIEQNRENLRIHSRINAAAERWIREKRSADLLLPSGKPLYEGRSLLENDATLTSYEAAFIEASMLAARKRQNIKRGVTAALAMLAVMTSLTAFFANQQRELAVEARTRAEIEAETAKQTTGFMVGLFEVSDPGEARGNTITAREIMDRGAERIAKELTAQPAIQATLMETMGTVYTSLGLYNQAVSLLQSALNKRKALYGSTHVEVARSMDRLGEVLKLKAEYESAEVMYREALAQRRELLGNAHADTARSIYELADLLGRMGDYAAAEPLFREALALHNDLHGPKSKETARSMEGLALNLYDQGDYTVSAALLRDAVAIQRELHDGPHPDLAQALNNLGFIITGAGEYAEAEQLFREALEMKRVLFAGDAHPEIAMGLNNIAFLLHQQRKYDSAEGLYREAKAMQVKLLGEQHPDVAMALNNLAFVTYEKGDLNAALAMSRESLEMYRQTVGDEHPSVARGLNNQAMWHMEDNDFAAAEPLLREALDLRRRLLGPEHADVAGSMTLLAGLLIDTGRFDEALAFASEAKTISLGALPSGHWRTASAASAEGAALAGLQQFQEAEKLLLESYGVLSNDPAAPLFYVASSRRWLAELYEALGRPRDAAKYLVLQGDSRRP